MEMQEELLDILLESLDFLLLLLPLVLPIIFTYFAISIWIDYRRRDYINSQEMTLIEVIPPIEMMKSPVAMELFLLALQQKSGETTWIDKYWHGKVRAWFSLEIASTDGKVHFYIQTRKALRGYIESQLYGQFPDVEVVEVDDYASKFEDESGKYSMFGIEMGLSEPDPYPIKTYVDFGLDKDPKEEFKVDPITPVIEFLGSLKKGENAWIQIIVRAHVKEDRDPNKWFGLTDLWKDTAATLVKELQEGSLQEIGEGDNKTKISNKTEGMKFKISALERSISKTAFDTGVRLIYIAEKDEFQGVNIGGLVGSFRQYGSPDLNSFKPIMVTDFNYPWQDPFGGKVKRMRKEILKAYKMRDYFWKDDYRGNKRKKIILNTEELATIFHFPGSVAGTPTLGRVPSKKSIAPSNLPT
ncbi:MAG: hypothetical protein ACI9GH_000421 [Candidatus Paceibacteria bacterium]|jgi:hypothetical protein